MPSVEDAEAALAALERPGHVTAAANNAFRMSEYSGDPEKIAAARADLDKAIADERAANINPRDIDRAAQAVLDARGEAHTEENVLPGGATHPQAGE